MSADTVMVKSAIATEPSPFQSRTCRLSECGKLAESSSSLGAELAMRWTLKCQGGLHNGFSVLYLLVACVLSISCSYLGTYTYNSSHVIIKVSRRRPVHPSRHRLTQVFRLRIPGPAGQHSPPGTYANPSRTTAIASCDAITVSCARLAESSPSPLSSQMSGF